MTRLWFPSLFVLFFVALSRSPAADGSARPDILEMITLAERESAAAATLAAQSPPRGAARPLQRLAVAENRRFLTAEGQPFFWVGDTAWELFHRLEWEEIRRYFADRASKGFNVIQAVALAELEGLTEPSRAGFLPLLDQDPARPDIRPGPADDYWDFIDAVISLAQEHGLYVGFLPTWGKYVTSHPFDGKVDGVFNTNNAAIYGRFLGARYRAHPNLIWILGGDKAPSTPEALAIWRAMAQGIAQGVTGKADFSRVLMTYHTSGPGNASDYVHDEPWLSFTSIQSSHGNRIVNWPAIEKNYARHPIKPVIDLESSYPDAWIRTEWLPSHLRSGMTSTGPSTDDHARRVAYWAVFSGAFGHTYGHNSIWQMYAPGRKSVLDAKVYWHEALNAPSASQMGHLRRLIEARPFLTQAPAPELVLQPSTDPLEHVAALRGQDYALIYTPTGKPFRLRAGQLLRKTARVSWFDPRTGKTTPAENAEMQGDLQFRTPGTPGTGNDWVLVIDQADISR